MAYTEFTLEKALKRFSLTVEIKELFPEITPQPLSNALREQLLEGIPLALRGGSEKARSEFIVAPILLTLRSRNKRIMIYSGARLDVEPESGLVGECDFLIAEGIALPSLLRTPILSILEAKKLDIEQGLGQCTAQLVAAQKLNQREGIETTVYGCVTTAEAWQFIRLEGKTLTLDSARLVIAQPEYEGVVGQLLGIFTQILKETLTRE
jgi:hypothetical protein